MSEYGRRGEGVERGAVDAEGLEQRDHQLAASAFGAVDDLERDPRTVRKPRREDALRAALADEPRYGAVDGEIGVAGAGDILGVGAVRVGDAPGGAVGRDGEGAESPCQTDGCGGERGSAAAVDGRVGDRLGRVLGERLADQLLQRVVRVKVGGDVPARPYGRAQHRRVLAGTVLRDGLGAAALADPRDARVRLDRHVGRVLEVGLGEAGAGEDRPYVGEVVWLAEVGCGRDRQLVPGHVETRAAHRDRLDRLERRPRIGGHRGVPERPAGAVREGHGSTSAMYALDHAASYDVDRYHVLLSLSHEGSG